MARWIGTLLVTGIAAAAVMGPVAPEQDSRADRARDTPWRVLVTNDDGIEAPGLRELVKALSKEAEVVVCAPDSNRSGASQAVPSLARPMTVTQVEVEGAVRALAVSGSPADAVCYAIVTMHAETPFDVVISGINSSANVGDQSHSSGTVGAAMEGVYRGVPAIAVSQGGRTRDYALAAKFATQFMNTLRTRGADPGVVYSINVPTSQAAKVQGVAVRPMGGTMIKVNGYRTLSTDGESSSVRSNLQFADSGPDGTDSGAFFDGFITVTPLQFDWTARKSLKTLQQWSLSVPD